MSLINGSFLYLEHPEYYDLIHANKDYLYEVSIIRKILRQAGINGDAYLIEAACGTGNYLQAFEKYFDIAGFDLSKAMIKIAKSKLPDQKIWVDCLTRFKSAKPADVIVCLCSALGYLQSIEQLNATCLNFFNSLRPGGVLLIKPWLTPDEASNGRMWMDWYNSHELKLCRQAVLKKDDKQSELSFHWLIARPNDGVIHELDIHKLYLFEENEIKTALNNVGFRAELIFNEELNQSFWLAIRNI